MLRSLLTLFLISTLSPNVFAVQDRPTRVFVTTVDSVPIADEVEALGTLQANENVNLMPSVTERITAIHFDDNAEVKKGDILVEMDAAEEEAELAAESSRKKEAERQVTRLRPLVKRGAASKSALDESERELATATARITAIESRINERRIRAPFDGVVGIRNISVGDMVSPGNMNSLITTIDDISRMKLDFAIPEVFLSTLKKGLQVTARASAYPDKVFEGVVTSIDSRIDPTTRTVKARAILENPEALLKAGMLMRLRLKQNPRSALVIPEATIATAGRKNFVMLVVEGDPLTIKKQEIEIGTRQVGQVEVLSGLKAGDRIVTDGILKVRDGSKIIVSANDNSEDSLPELLNQDS